MEVRAKKYLGQHFLKDLNIAKKIASSLTFHQDYRALIEIGPGMGVLTRFLLEREDCELSAIDLDGESVAYLEKNLAPSHRFRIIHGDFLKTDIKALFPGQFGVIGNFPYNISSQILFKLLENREHIPELVGMFQKEVAERICIDEGSKTYGILSVLVGAFYERKILFKVPPSVFAPPPKVDSAVLRLTRKEHFRLDCDEKLFFRVVKQSFQNRRKTLRNALKAINLPEALQQDDILNKRAEQLSIIQFIELTKKIEAFWKTSTK